MAFRQNLADCNGTIFGTGIGMNVVNNSNNHGVFFASCLKNCEFPNYSNLPMLVQRTLPTASNCNYDSSNTHNTFKCIFVVFITFSLFYQDSVIINVVIINRIFTPPPSLGGRYHLGRCSFAPTCQVPGTRLPVNAALLVT